MTRLITIADMPMHARTPDGRGANVLGLLALLVDDELLAAFATTSPERGPAAALGGVVGTADSQHGNAAAAPDPAGRPSWARPAGPSDATT